MSVGVYCRLIQLLIIGGGGGGRDEGAIARSGQGEEKYGGKVLQTLFSHSRSSRGHFKSSDLRLEFLASNFIPLECQQCNSLLALSLVTTAPAFKHLIYSVWISQNVIAKELPHTAHSLFTRQFYNHYLQV